MATTRRTRWYPTPPPTPKILHLPRRNRRKTTKNLPGKSIFGKESSESTRRNDHRGKLETLFHQERAFSKTVPIVLLSSSGDCERRERVEEDFEFREKFEEDEEEEKWRFQAEILRAECNFLRMEREIALRKLEMNQVQTKKTLHSAGKTKIYEGKNVGAVLEEEIEDLEEKLDDFRRKSGVTDIEIRKCTNFDKKAAVLQRKLESLRFEERSFFKEIQQVAEASLNFKTTRCRFNDPNIIGCDRDQTSRFTDVEILGRKMEGLSKGMFERMEEEYRSMLSSSSSSSSCSSSATISGTSSASSSSRFEFLHSSSSSSLIHHHREQRQERTIHQQQVCSGRCKAIVRKIIEQVRSEMEQWCQMQDMLGWVRKEMEELQVSRDYWEDRALNSDGHVQSLQSAMEEWKDKALASENRVSELQKQMSDLHMELTKSKTECNMDASRTRSLGRTRWDLSQKEKEKRVLICSLKENHQPNPNNKQNKNYTEISRTKDCTLCSGGITGSNGSPLQEVANSSSSLRFPQIGRVVQSSPLYSSENHVYQANSRKQNKDYAEIPKTRECTIRSGIICSNRPPLQEIENSSSSPKFREISRAVQSSPLYSSENPQANCHKQNKEYSDIGRNKERAF